LPRFLSIIIITAIGVAFFAGLRITGPYMQYNTNLYLNEQNAMDISIVSTLGFDAADVAAIRNTAGVLDVYAGYNANVLVKVDRGGDEVSSQVLSIDPRTASGGGLNAPKLLAGRLPATSGECLVEQKFLDVSGLKIGDFVYFSSGTSDSIYDTLGHSVFQIVGVAESPLFLAEDRGASEIGNGKNSYFFLIPQQDFALSAYTEVYVKSVEKGTGPAGIDTTTGGLRFSPAYNDQVAAQVARLEDTATTQTPLRLQALQDSANRQISLAERQIDDGQAQLDNAQAQLDAARTRLDASQQTLDASKQKLDQSRATLDSGWSQLAAARSQLDAGWAKLGPAQDALTAAQAQLDASQQEIASGRAQLEAAQAAGLLSPGAYEQKAAELSAAEAAYEQGLAAFQAQSAAFDSARDDLNAGEAAYTANRQKLQSGEDSYASGLASYRSGLAAYEDGEAAYAENLAKFDAAEPASQAKLDDARAKLATAQQALGDLKTPTWYVLGITDNAGFFSFQSESDQLKALATIVPAFFFLIAALVSMTAVTRLVESDRVQIGVFKALGYRSRAIVGRYFVYALAASLIGSVIGVIVAFTTLPQVIFNAFGALFQIPHLVAPFSLPYALASMGIAAFAAVVPALLVVRGAVREAPAEAMRPAAPKAGKRIFLERLAPLWRRFSFLQKVTARNLFRYKKRLLMTVFGVAGCTALMFTALGLHDALLTLPVKQYGEMLKYDVSVDFRLAAGEPQSDLDARLQASSALTAQTDVLAETLRITNGQLTKDINLVASFTPQTFGDFVNLRSRATAFNPAVSYSLTDGGVILTEQIARQLGVEVGGQVTLRTLEGVEATLPVEGIVENYTLHYVYMTADTYAQAFGTTPTPNRILGFLPAGQAKLPASVANDPDVTAVSYMSDQTASLNNQLNVLTFVIIILVAAAAALIFVVLFSLTTINIEERRRELASLEVLGMTDREIAAYIYRENIVITLIGTLVGLGLGFLLQRYVITTLEIDVFMFSRDILWTTWVFSIALTLFFALIVNLGMYRSLVRIDMVEALKAVE